MGEFHRSLDEKGRLAIPANWRIKSTSIDNNFLALPAPDGNISVYPPRMIAQLESRVSQISLGDIEGQKAITDLMSKAHSFNYDKQGRINLNNKLMEHIDLGLSEIEKEVVLIGKLSTFSIYSKKGYIKFQSSYSDKVSTKADIFQRFGL